MSIQNVKTLKIVICGLLLVSILSNACAGAGAGKTTAPAEIEVMKMKVATSSGAASGIYAGDYYPGYPEFEKISVDPAYQYLKLKPGDSKNFTVTVGNKDNKTIALYPGPVIIPY
ncbi:hypothetical protein [Methanosarcina sp. WWM596]|nr:hypothetical protein [Methanosarcina sp. WWM596]AKB17039.1 hypothetical protein MSWHS_0176 [Methanosarcina sp. WWM596]